MRLVKFTLAMTILTIIVTLSMLIGIAVTYQPEIPDSEIGGIGGGEEITPPAIDIELSMAVIPDADGKVPEGGVSAGDDKANVEIPAGVQLEEGVDALTFTVINLEETQSTVSTTHRSEVMHSMDVHIDGVSKSNTIPMTIKLNGILPTGLNSNNVKLFHVENGETIEMTLTTTPVNHNEFSYNPLTGDAVITIASFSEIVAYGDTAAKWDGKTYNYDWYNTTDKDFEIANAEQLAGFRAIVDGGYYVDGEGEGAKKTWTPAPYQDSFEGKTVTLSNNIDLGDHLFDPIGFGYDYDGFMTDGKTFNGTFDGDGKTIFGLYQNGWDLDPNPGVYDTYTYSMAGGGLFASVVDATIKNLTMSGADIVFECVDMGVVCGYAQGNCTFDNINIINCTIQNYNRYTGGVVGECSPRYDAEGNVLHSNHIFEDITVDSTTVISSLWGSFDTSLGGILGGKWDKYGDATTVTMRRCNVACQIDAFNDVTSAYQWYAYRRAGMLVGNTEQSASNKALANFLTCEDVFVIYGSWNNYSYCEFENQSDAEGNSSSWNRYPWVRVQEGLSCGAYSNPRYGNPIVNGTAITSDAHEHATGDECHVYLPFEQLYGGGQGVYGATEHPGVTEGIYSVTYKDGDKTLKVDIIGKNDVEYTLWGVENYEVGGKNPIAWTDVNGNRISSIDAGNNVHYTVYAKWPKTLTFSIVDDHSDVLYSEEFEEGSDFTPNAEEIQKAIDNLQNKVDSSKEFIQVVLDKEIPGNLKDATENVVITAKYNIDGMSLEPVYENGVLVAYRHTNGINSSEQEEDVVIPGYVGNIPIIEVQLANKAFAENEELLSIKLPANIQSIGSNALEKGPQSNSGSNITKGRSEITIYYSGTAKQWQEYMDYIYKNKDLYNDYNQNTITIGAGKQCLASDWDNGLEKGSRIFFLDANGKVDASQGYWELYYEQDGLSFIAGSHKYTWVYHNHAYGADHDSNCSAHHNSIGTDYTNRADSAYWPSEQ